MPLPPIRWRPFCASFVLLAAGPAYGAEVPRGRILGKHRVDGIDHPYMLLVPLDYDPARRYPVRVYLHGGVDPLYPVRSVEPFVRQFQRSGVVLEFVAKPEDGHTVRWWDDEAERVESFLQQATRTPLPTTVVWETFDLSLPLRVVVNGVENVSRIVEPDPEVLLRWAAQDLDRTMLFAAELEITV